MKISVWLYLDLKNMELNHTGNGPTEQQMDVATADETRSQLFPLGGGNVAELRSVGQVEISDEATLEDLKTQVEQSSNLLQLNTSQ